MTHMTLIIVAVCGIKFPTRESNPGPMRWERSLLATGPPAKSLYDAFVGFRVSFPAPVL